MKKETIIAITLGILAGVGIAIFTIRSTQLNKSTSDEILTDQVTPTVSIETSDIKPLLINEPDDQSVVTKSSVTVKGTAENDSLIVIQTPEYEKTLIPENNLFEDEIPLFEGENVILVTAYIDKNIDTRTLKVYYIPEE